MALWITDLLVGSPTSSNQPASKLYIDSRALTTVRKTTDQSVTSSTTLVNDSDLAFSAAASTNYLVEVWLSCTKTSTSVLPIRVAWSTPSGASFSWSRWLGVYGNGNTFGGLPSSFSALNLGNAQTQTTFVVHGVLVFSTSSAGTMTLQWAQATSDAVATVVKTDSLLTYRTFT